MTRAFVDTNVLAYLFDSREPAKQARSEAVLQSGAELVISTQVLLELFAVLTRKFEPALSPAEGERILRGLSRWEVAPADSELVLRAARTSNEHQLSIWDAMIVEAAREAGCDEVWTEDLAAGASLRGVRVVNPYE